MQNREKCPTKSKSAYEVFLGNSPRNISLALITVPSEGLALRRIFDVLANPATKPTPYTTVISEIGLKGTFAGSMSRVSYCLTGNLATLMGLEYFGTDTTGVVKTTIAKNAIIPLFLLSNARQTGRNFEETKSYIAKGIKDPSVHFSFFFRNLVANSCLIPGFKLRDHLYETQGEKNILTANLAGYGTSIITSTAMNALLKPFFTGGGIYSLSLRSATAIRFPAVIALALREAASLGLVFFNSAPKKKSEASSQNDNRNTQRKV